MPPPPPSPMPGTPPTPIVEEEDTTTLIIVAIVAPIAVVIFMLGLTYGLYKYKKWHDLEEEKKSDDASGIYLVADFIFKKVDKDKSGTVELEEMTEFLCGPGGMSGPEVKALVERMDTDGNGSIDRDEWRTAWVGGLAMQISKMRSHEVQQAQTATGRMSMAQFTGKDADHGKLPGQDEEGEKVAVRNSYFEKNRGNADEDDEEKGPAA